MFSQDTNPYHHTDDVSNAGVAKTFSWMPLDSCCTTFRTIQMNPGLICEQDPVPVLPYKPKMPSTPSSACLMVTQIETLPIAEGWGGCCAPSSSSVGSATNWSQPSNWPSCWCISLVSKSQWTNSCSAMTTRNYPISPDWEIDISLRILIQTEVTV